MSQFDDDVLAGLNPTLQGVPEFSQRLGAAAAAPTPFQERLALERGRAVRIANNPAVQALMAAGNPGMGLTGPVAGLLGQKLGIGTRNPTSFEREGAAGEVTSPGGTMQRLTPIEPGATADTDIPMSPTLDPRYQLRRPALIGGPGGGGSGAGLKAAFDASRQRMVGDYDTDKELALEQGVNQATRAEGIASLQEQEAQIKERHAQLQMEADAKAAEKHEAFLARNEQLASEIAEQKVDFKGAMGNAAEKALMVLGSMLMARAGEGDRAMKMLNTHIDTAIREQQQQIDNKKTALGARQTIFGQMLQETGDRRLAAMQTRNLMLEAAKQKVQADAERLGIPALRTQAQQVANQFQHQQDALKTQIAGEAYQSFLAQQRAAAAAQAAAEEKAWKRSMEIAELGLKRDKLEIERLDAINKAGGNIPEQVQKLGKDLSDKDLVEGRSAVDNAKRRLAGTKPDEGLPGVGPMADFREKIARRPEGLGALNPMAWALNKSVGLSDEERVSRGDWDKIKLAYQKQITGSGASESEREMISKAFEGAKSPAEQRNAINQADNFFQELEARKKAGYDPRAVQIFEQRLKGINPQIPDSVRVKK